MKEPLKDKIKRLDLFIRPSHSCFGKDMVLLKDVKSAVEWLKKEVTMLEDDSDFDYRVQFMFLINKAFPDLEESGELDE